LKGCICVFAKPPLPGEAKTRLVPALGAQGAAALARAFLEDTWALTTSRSWARAVLATTAPFSVPGSGEPWLQGPGDLGVRLETILRRALLEHPFAIALGADAPDLPASRLEDARAALESSDAVIGPATDGGFYLLGLKQCPEGIFAGIAWSRPDTGRTLEDRLAERGWRVRRLEPWSDVDEPGDLAALRERIPSGSATAQALLRMPGHG
jgi:rSAM/selenodomain-associated transferase 1